MTQNTNSKVTVILGASSNPERYSNRAQRKLVNYGHPVIPVTPKGGVIENETTFRDMTEINASVDTVTIYLNPSRLNNEIDKIISLKPKRVIFNPGSESPDAMAKLAANGIEVIEDCTLILLNNDRY
ncbi:CoA-binding protein [Aliikangiella coralliicola]|uniref:CoA-binding protein n=2 Tax=Aliikangiella coralliicola TaxID=2592383 RepID=A0A545UCL8_9GAMM|nr:CoA-binding protein [Aliikangiella coralliicola]